jgi:NAD(P)-dependent dehydrogenase (short-subunit alcohol dehydrogenase family)
MNVALITGGGSLIGKGVADALAGRGWSLAIADLDRANAHEVAAACGERAQTVVFDVTDKTAVDSAVRDLVAKHGRIDALVNCAGGMRGLGLERKPFADTPPVEWDQILNANLKGVLNCCHAVLPAMIAARRGGIVSVAAARGLRGGPLASIYSAAKAAIIVFSQSLAQEVGPLGIRVNTVAPGSVEARWRTPDLIPPPPPLGRDTSARDVGEAVAFLLSDEASHITGACLDISGGSALH